MKKKRLLAVTLTLSVLLCAVFSTPAFAANETTGSTSVTYTIQGGYTINIPSSVSLNAGGAASAITFTASDVVLESNQMVVVRIDAERTLNSDGQLLLSSGSGETISCQLFRGNTSVNTDYSVREKITWKSGQEDPMVASFHSARGSEIGAYSYGFLSADPLLTGYNGAGKYTGTIYFTIGVEEIE